MLSYESLSKAGKTVGWFTLIVVCLFVLLFIVLSLLGFVFGLIGLIFAVGTDSDSDPTPTTASRT